MKAIQFNFGALVAQANSCTWTWSSQATKIPRPTKSKYDSKLAVNKSITYIKKN